MIQLITGSKGTGKTKIIIDAANQKVETAAGNIVFLTDTDRYTREIRHEIRVINTQEYALKHSGEQFVNEDCLIGFIQGILACNYDIECLYIDGAHRMLGRTVAEMEDFFTDIYKIGGMTETCFVITVSEDEKNFPDFLKKYI